MMDEYHDRHKLEELQSLLDVWGGDPARWPVRVRGEIARLSVGPEAARLLAEARSFDRALDRARELPAAITEADGRALSERIVAAALAAPVPGPVSEKPKGEVVALRRPQRPGPDARGFGRAWGTAALLAASLLVGVYLGGNINMLPVLQEVAEAVGISTVVDPSVAVLVDELAEEDAL